MMLTGMVSGRIQAWLHYPMFFAFVLLASIPPSSSRGSRHFGHRTRQQPKRRPRNQDAVPEERICAPCPPKCAFDFAAVRISPTKKTVPVNFLRFLPVCALDGRGRVLAS